MSVKCQKRIFVAYWSHRDNQQNNTTDYNGNRGN